jgi:hypothetical protein
MDGDPCDIDLRYACGYEDTVICGDSFYSTSFDSPFERNCSCSESDSTFSCEDSLCPVICPDTQPVHGDFCGDAQILDERFGSCVYGELCCPGVNGESISDEVSVLL